MARDGMAGNFFRKQGYVNLQYMPDPKQEYVAAFENLTGGMNIFDLEYKLKPNESPLIKNLTWRNGMLGCRRGQEKLTRIAWGGEVHEVYQSLFHGRIIFHAGSCLYSYDVETKDYMVLRREVPDVAGSFFRYNEYLMYKGPGYYYRLNSAFAVSSLGIFPRNDPSEFNAYVPTIQLNTDPDTGAGDEYQPENRLSQYRRVMYNAKSGSMDYYCPLPHFDGAKSVRVNGVLWSYVQSEDQLSPNPDDKHYYVNVEQQKVTFNQDVAEDPPRNNTVEIVFEVAGEEVTKSRENIMNCGIATVFGGTQELCVVLAGDPNQPNAYYWSGNTSNIMDPTYFPANQYNLAGDSSEAITAFGKQQNMLVIFKENSVGRATFGTVELNDRAQITMDYTRINAETGCDLPRTIQLIDNNLVWCNRQAGVHILRDSSAAYENNIVCISKKINGDYRHDGLFALMKNADPADACSVDTDRKYIVVYRGEAYEWNYTLSEYDNPSWFYHTGIRAKGFAQDLDRLWEITSEGAIAEFRPIYSDYNPDPQEWADPDKKYIAIDKVYTLPTQYFGSYDRLKNIKSILVSTRADATTRTYLDYECDWAKRTDATPIETSTWSLVPRDLTFRDLATRSYAAVARRKPGWHNVHHFKMTLRNNERGRDLNVGSIQIFYTYRGRTR